MPMRAPFHGKQPGLTQNTFVLVLLFPWKCDSSVKCEPIICREKTFRNCRSQWCHTPPASLHMVFEVIFCREQHLVVSGCKYIKPRWFLRTLSCTTQFVKLLLPFCIQVFVFSLGPQHVADAVSTQIAWSWVSTLFLLITAFCVHSADTQPQLANDCECTHIARKELQKSISLNTRNTVHIANILIFVLGAASKYANGRGIKPSDPRRPTKQIISPNKQSHTQMKTNRWSHVLNAAHNVNIYAITPWKQIMLMPKTFTQKNVVSNSDYQPLKKLLTNLSLSDCTLPFLLAPTTPWLRIHVCLCKVSAVSNSTCAAC